MTSPKVASMFPPRMLATASHERVALLVHRLTTIMVCHQSSRQEYNPKAAVSSGSEYPILFDRLTQMQ